MRDKSERMKAFLEKHPSLNQPPPSIAERTRRHRQVSRYPEFCCTLLDRFPDRHFVFFERDALPFKWVMGELLGAAHHARLHHLYLNGKMMSETLVEMISKFESRPQKKTYELRRRLVRAYVRDANAERDPAIRFVRQELAAIPERAVLVDSGFWGTMPLFVQAVLPKKQFDVELFVGPAGSPSFLTDTSGPNGAARRAEDYFDFAYEAEGLTEIDGKLQPDLTWNTWNTALPQRFEEQKAAVLELAREWALARR